MSGIRDRLRERAAAASGEPALVAYAGSRLSVWTWAELDRVTASIAARVAASGGRPGRSVLLATAGNDPQTVLEMIGMLRTGAPLAVLPRKAPQAEAAVLADTLRRCGHDVVRIRDGRTDLARSSMRLSRALPAESVLLPTGGSSGRPKIVVDTRIRTVARRPRPTRPTSVMHWHPGQRQVIVGPLYHAASLAFFAEGLADGNTLIVSRSFDPVAVLETIEQWRAEWLQLTPYHMRLLAVAARRGRSCLSSVRGLLHLAAPCPHQTKKEWIDLLGADHIFEMYAATEGIGVTVATGGEWLRHPGTVGRGFFTRIRILDDAGESLPPGEAGKVYMRAGSPTQRCYLSGSAGLNVTVDGFVSVGDRGWLDPDGYLYLAPRQLTRIQVGGETVDPGEVESALLEHPDVLDAGVAGVPDARIGEALVALVVPSGRHDPRRIRHYLRGRVARHKVPRVLHFTGQIPRSDAGKLDRRRLAELAEMAARASHADEK